jgi:sigma-B regulation protein RsbU (phosphoserine phosphatase)
MSKSKDELLEELESLRQQAAEYTELLKRLTALEREHADLKQICDERTMELNQECAFRDQSEEALKMAQVIIDRSPVVLFRRVAGDDPRLVYVSNNVIQFGYTAEEFLNDKIRFKDIVHPDDSERVGEEIMGYADKDAEEYTQFYRMISKTGDVRWVEDQTSVVRDAQGKKTHNQGILVDITERKTAEDQLRKNEEKFRRIVETAGEGFLLMDRHHVITDVNDAYCRMLGFQREEILGKTPTDLASPEDKQFMLINKEEILSEEYRNFEGTMIAKDGCSRNRSFYDLVLFNNRSRKQPNGLGAGRP